MVFCLLRFRDNGLLGVVQMLREFQIDRRTFKKKFIVRRDGANSETVVEMVVQLL